MREGEAGGLEPSAKMNRPLELVCFVFPIEVPEELDPLSFHELRVHMHVNKTKFERNSSLEYYHMTCIGKQNLQGKRGLFSRQA